MSRFTPRSTRSGALLLAGLLAGCAPSDPRAPGERLGQGEAPIINGAPDSTHHAVVAVLGSNYECSGTILQVKNGIGYVLTAAHCCPAGDLPVQVVMGADYNSGKVFDIVPGSQLADPCYQSCPGSTDDVCMVKFSGASASTPTIPAMTSQTDALQVGTPITYVGYGIIASPPGGNNSQRNYVAKTIGALDSYFVQYADPSSSGTCEGDSGGPGLVVVNGAELVASVTSYGDKPCMALGVSIRTSAVYDGFIGPYLNDAASNPSCPKDFDCQACSQTAESAQCGGGCAQKTSDCFADAACAALIQCYQGCGAQACITACNTAHVGGLQKYEAIDACLCTGSCASACHNQLCVSPKCGTKPKNSPATCGACVEDNCCAEAWTCSTDAACKKCFNAATPDPSCAGNAAAVAYYQCAHKSCAATGCSLKDPAGGGATTSSGVAASSGGATGSSGGVGGAGAGGATSGGGAAHGATGSGGNVSQKSGCAVGASADDELPAAPVAALILGVAAALQRRRRGVRRH